jgi:D-alanyl-lipoteichoic acid acyltransferase DltB (MBOAT superfamily)
MRFYQHPVFDLQLPEWWRFKAQMPPGVFLFVVPVIIGMFVPQKWVRGYLLLTSLAAIVLVWGYFYFACILSAVIFGWLLCLLARWANRHKPRWTRIVHAAGWVVCNAIYFSMFAMPVNHLLAGAEKLDILLLCGPGFLLFRFLGLFSDICRGKDVGSIQLDRFVLFLLYAPTFRLGPMTRYEEMNNELDTSKTRITPKNILTAIFLIFLGFGQLMLVDEIINEWLVDKYHERTFFFAKGFFNDAPNLTYGENLIGMYCVAFRFLFGFSGYSYVAMGISLLMGVRLPKNFDLPYLASNLQEFWRRWHTSLGQWLRDYVYIPIGGKNRRNLGILVTFLYCFLWHQPTVNMILFGLIHAIGMILGDFWRRWIDRASAEKGLLYFAVHKHPMIGKLIGIALTFHFWCLSLLVMFDPDHCGWWVMKKLFFIP